MKLAIGDMVYVYQECMFKECQIVGELQKIQEVPAYGGGTTKLYFVKMLDGTVVTTYFYSDSLDHCVAIRKRARPDLPVFSLWRQVNEFRQGGNSERI